MHQALTIALITIAFSTASAQTNQSAPKGELDEQTLKSLAAAEEHPRDVATCWNVLEIKESTPPSKISPKLQVKIEKRLAKCKQEHKNKPFLLKEFEFNGISWGASEKQVRKTLKEQGFKHVESKTNSVYFGEVGGMAAMVHPTFLEDRLASVNVLFEEDHMNARKYLKDYETLLKLLGKKYGEPIMSERKVHNDLLDDPATALQAGHHSYLALFAAGAGTFAGAVLEGENFEINMILTYQGPLADAQREANEEEDASTL